MIVILGLLVTAELWRFFTVHNDHAAIDGVLCAYIGAWTLRDRMKQPTLAIDLAAIFIIVFVTILLWIMR